MLPNHGISNSINNNNNGNHRKYSLFSVSSNNSSTTPLLTNLFNIGGNNSNDNLLGENNSESKNQRRHIEMTSNNNSSIVCQKCRRFEVDLTNTSDELNAIDGELKASRQVISLLQRQLELLRVEKEGLEKLIITQQNSRNTLKSQQETIRDNKTSDDLICINTDDNSSIINDKEKDNKPLEESQKILLDLIQTQLYAKDEEIVKLKFHLKETQNDKEQLSLQLHLLEEDNAKLKSENTILSENLTLRDQTIISLSNEVFEQTNSSNNQANDFKLSQNSRRQSSVDITNFGQQQLSNIKAQRHIAKLIDTIDAYKKTNELLSNNVMSLTEKCNIIEKREIETRSQCQELEAKCCQIQSKLLSLLKEIEQSSKQEINLDNKKNGDKGKDDSIKQDVICSESVKLLIKRLLEDKSLDIPLSWKEGNKSLNDNNRTIRDGNNRSSRLNNLKYECDELGFYIENYEDNNEKLIDNNNYSNNSSPSRNFKRQQSINVFPDITTTIGSTTSSSSRSFTALPTVEEAIETSEFVSQLKELQPIQQQQQRDLIPIDEEFSSSNPTRRGNIVRHLSVDSSKSDETRWHLKWDYFIKDFDKILDLNKSKDFKLLLRSGVPQEYRCKVWKALVDLHIGKERKNYGPDYYQNLLQTNRTGTTKTSTINNNNQSKKVSLNPSSKQIELDLLRTLPNNKHFESLSSPGTLRLRNILFAYSEHNKSVGYCQGMNRLAAVALLILPEEEAFYLLVALIEKIMPQGYYNDLWLAQVDSAVVMDFVAIKMPNLSEHFKQNNVDLSLFAWFLTIFVDGTPPALFLRIWDCYLFEGDKILFRVALALLKMYESKILMLNNSVSINNFLRSTVNEPMNIDQFFEIAFEWINPLSSRSLKAKRQYHLQIMKSGFETFGKSNSDDENNDAKNRKKEDSTYVDPNII